MSTIEAKAAPGSRQNKRMKGWVALGAAILLSFVLFVVIRVQGHVQGTEFSPTHFQTRAFSFFEIPLLHLQITPIRRTANTPATATYVRQNGLIPVVQGSPTTWHLVSISRGLTGSIPAAADFLLQQLNLQLDGGPYWEQWSIDHPRQSSVFWPVIQRLADRELYVLIPALFEIAQQDRDDTTQGAAQLRAAINDHLRSEYYDLINDMREAGRADLASQLREEALADFPEDERLRNADVGATDASEGTVLSGHNGSNS